MDDAPAALPAASFLQLIWLASPALPVGGFSYSEGLEAGIEWAGLGTEQAASDWLVHQLNLSLARADLAVLAQAIPAWRSGDMPRVRTLNAWVFQTRESAEFLLQTEQMGRSFVEWLKLHHDDAATVFEALPASYPIAFAFAASRTEAAVRDACLAFAFGWAENMIGAAVKAVPLGQSAGQRMLGRLAAEIPTAVDLAITLTDDDRQAFSPMLAILSSRHETQYSRLFRS
ncbi:urease accessory UreF family protein [Variovorax sp. J22R24]|uniref:urease accessory protein UreF n=1 Tax=Variovorax gracilis TaxID=3053502 RepID=UPI002575AB79|nr:urease accessory UreF family protein [Variovorax sp. J22R24]MDM0105000.1 urease accessory UreF family protein [Variovorax sp. J22R24]